RAGIHALRTAVRPYRDILVGLLLDRIQGRRRLLDPDRGADLPADRNSRPAGGGEGVSGADPVSNQAAPSPPTLPLLAALKDATLAALVAFGLFFFMIGLRTEQGLTGALEITTRFETFAILVGAVFVGSFLRTLIFGRAAIPLGNAVPLPVMRLFTGAGRFAGPALL